MPDIKSGNLTINIVWPEGDLDIESFVWILYGGQGKIGQWSLGEVGHNSLWWNEKTRCMVWRLETKLLINHFTQFQSSMLGLTVNFQHRKGLDFSLLIRGSTHICSWVLKGDIGDSQDMAFLRNFWSKWSLQLQEEGMNLAWSFQHNIMYCGDLKKVKYMT